MRRHHDCASTEDNLHKLRAEVERLRAEVEAEQRRGQFDYTRAKTLRAALSEARWLLVEAEDKCDCLEWDSKRCDWCERRDAFLAAYPEHVSHSGQPPSGVTGMRNTPPEASAPAATYGACSRCGGHGYVIVPPDVQQPCWQCATNAARTPPPEASARPARAHEACEMMDQACNAPDCTMRAQPPEPAPHCDDQECWCATTPEPARSGDEE